MYYNNKRVFNGKKREKANFIQFHQDNEKYFSSLPLRIPLTGISKLFQRNQLISAVPVNLVVQTKFCTLKTLSHSNL